MLHVNERYVDETRDEKGNVVDYQYKYPEIKRLTPHELRHTRATLSANDDDVDLFQLAKLLGHSDLNMLIKRYAHTDVEAMRKALKIGDKDG